ncbi:CheR family methyltransferase [Gloeothece verrucosa]|uniref:protein-glutamate O-methyltransferase n=1 Tax=Gloeothece verrucosa (strain PCC 7822) TaxID=497965 RepID=E0UKJ7_GLOV7|nr:CheR family methyltransferase [Gloeothece verrucosa]ADN17477.1 MCP methyltransferase, CheR-type [Gloeothece verrucosa PCC 7822]
MNPPEVNLEFEALLNYLKDSRGCDLTAYKRSTLIRRFQYRMQSINIDNYQNYLQYLQQHPQEYSALLDDVLINFTSFFRDPEAWDYLAKAIIPKILKSKHTDEPIRVWSAGCAAGQEIYSLTILLAEVLGTDECLKRVQVYATDIDEVALTQAREGIYSEQQMIGLSANLIEKYFKPIEGNYVFDRTLRHKIIFGKHDLAKNAPISKIDLLVCRNVLMYFYSETQSSILVRFHFALKNTGFLLLGQTDILTQHREIFTPINLKLRIYAKGLNLEVEHVLSLNPKSSKKPTLARFTTDQSFWKTIFETSPVAQLCVDFKGYLIAANERANILFGLTLDDLNRSFLELEPGKLLDSHASGKSLYHKRRRATLKNIEWRTSSSTRHFDVESVPLFNSEKKFLGITLTFFEKSLSK